MSKSDMAQSSGKSKASTDVRDSDLWYKRYPRKFKEATSEMPFELRAAYGLIIDLYYERGGPLPDDDKWIACALFIDVRKWKPIRAGLFKHGKLYVGPDHMIHNDTADDLIAERAASLEASSEAQKRKRSKRNTGDNLPRNLGTTSGGTEGDFSEKPNKNSDGALQIKNKKKTVEKDTVESPSKVGESNGLEERELFFDGTDGLVRLPFTEETVRRVIAMDVDPTKLIRRFFDKTTKIGVIDPDGYLMEMAREQVAKKHGITTDAVQDLERARTRDEQAVIAANVVGAFSRPSEERVKSARRYDAARAEEALARLAGKTFTSQAAADKAFAAELQIIRFQQGGGGARLTR